MRMRNVYWMMVATVVFVIGGLFVVERLGISAATTQWIALGMGIMGAIGAVLTVIDAETGIFSKRLWPWLKRRLGRSKVSR